MKNPIIPILAACAVTLATVGVVVAAEPASANSPCATRAEFRQIHPGQSVRTTQRIVGSPGKVTIGSSYMSQRQWRACPGSGYWLTVTYVNGRVDNKIML